MAPAIDHYAILGLAFGASPEEIKKAHKKMALMYHPDKVQAKGGDPEVASAKFREIQESYQVSSRLSP
ncbi:DnaJ domain-containing protein [Baffinella frigidus]|nr:DnaJ domain-containing protein [Cryptophyta sp. CCMP2293]